MNYQDNIRKRKELIRKLNQEKQMNDYRENQRKASTYNTVKNIYSNGKSLGNMGNNLKGYGNRLNAVGDKLAGSSNGFASNIGNTAKGIGNKLTTAGDKVNMVKTGINNKIGNTAIGQGTKALGSKVANSAATQGAKALGGKVAQSAIGQGLKAGAGKLAASAAGKALTGLAGKAIGLAAGPVGWGVMAAKMVYDMVKAAKAKRDAKAMAESEKASMEAISNNKQRQNNLAQGMTEQQGKMEEQMDAIKSNMNQAPEEQGYMGTLPELPSEQLPTENPIMPTQENNIISSPVSNNTNIENPLQGNILTDTINDAVGGFNNMIGDNPLIKNIKGVTQMGDERDNMVSRLMGMFRGEQPVATGGAAPALQSQAPAPGPALDPNAGAQQAVEDEKANLISNLMSKIGSGFRDMNEGYKDNVYNSFTNGDVYKNATQQPEVQQPVQMTPEGALIGGATEVQPKNFMNRLGELAGTTQRILSKPMVQGAIATGISAANGNDIGSSLEYGFNWGKDKAISDKYRQMIDPDAAPSLLGGYTNSDYNTYLSNEGLKDRREKEEYTRQRNAEKDAHQMAKDREDLELKKRELNAKINGSGYYNKNYSRYGDSSREDKYALDLLIKQRDDAKAQNDERAVNFYQNQINQLGGYNPQAQNSVEDNTVNNNEQYTVDNTVLMRDKNTGKVGRVPKDRIAEAEANNYEIYDSSTQRPESKSIVNKETKSSEPEIVVIKRGDDTMKIKKKHLDLFRKQGWELA